MSAPDSVEWPQPPSSRGALPYCDHIQYNPNIPGSIDEKSKLWRIVTNSSDTLLEIWTIKLFIKGVFDDFKGSARTALTKTANDAGSVGNTFIDDYVYLLELQTLLDYFLTSIEGPALWDLEESTIGLFPFIKFLVTVLALLVRIFYPPKYRLQSYSPTTGFRISRPIIWTPALGCCIHSSQVPYQDRPRYHPELARILIPSNHSNGGKSYVVFYLQWAGSWG